MARKKVVLKEQAPLTDAERKKRLDTIIQTISQKKDIVIGKLSDPEVQKRLTIDFIPTPSVNFNAAVGGGFPKGKITILSGVEDSGKTSIVLETIGKMHREHPEGHFALWIESEASLNLDYIVNTFGVDPDRFYLIRFDREYAAEDCLDQAEALINSGAIEIFCINTLKALIPKSELNKSMEEVSVAAQARMNSSLVKKFVPLIDEYGTAMILIQHMTTNIGGFSMYGDNLVMAGGKAIRTASMLTVDMRKGSVIDTDPIGREDGVKINCTVKKNHCLPNEFPYRKFSYYAIFGEGIEQILSALDELVEKQIIIKAGAWLQEIDPETGEIIDKWNGKTAFREDMIKNPDKLKRFQSMLDGTFTEMTEQEVIDMKTAEEAGGEEE